MFTRKQYLNNECSHQDYYGQFVTASIKTHVLQRISEKEINESRDEHFNDISLNRWDSIFQSGLPAATAKQMREAGDYPTMAGHVCITKEAARQLKSDAE